MVSNRQAETERRSVRSVEGTLQSEGWYVAVGSGELFLVYRGHVLILRCSNSFPLRLTDPGGPW